MDDHDWSENYQKAILKFETHIFVSDGRLVLDAASGESIGVEDPVMFADLKRSLEETNKKIKNEEIRIEDILILKNSR